MAVIQCRYCGADIDFIRQAVTGVPIPVEAKPIFYDREGRDVIITPLGQRVEGRILMRDDPRAGYMGYIPHRFSCSRNKEEER